jgi:hypothetical protein
MNSNNNEAIALFTKVFMNLTVRWSEVSSFRQVVQLGLPHAHAALASENIRVAKRMLEDPGNDALFLDKPGFIQNVGGHSGMGGAMTASQMSVFNLSVDAASLVFMHSTLDASVQDLCAICAIVAPADWERLVGNQKVSLAEVRADGYAALLDKRIAKHLHVLSRQSLVKRVDRLFELCKPTAASSRPGYSYDRDRLVAIDRERQNVIHGDGVALANVATTIEYLLETGLYLLGIVNERYDVRMDPELAMRAHGWAGLSLSSKP